MHAVLDVVNKIVYELKSECETFGLNIVREFFAAGQFTVKKILVPVRLCQMRLG